MSDRQRQSSPEEQGSTSTADTALVRFAREYGWRAYAVPVLIVITVLVIISMVLNPDEAVVNPTSTISTATPAKDTSEPDNGDDATSTEPEFAPRPEADVGLLDLPPGGPYTQNGTGTYTVVGQPGASAGSGDELVLRYVVEVEDGVDPSQYGGDDAFAALVDATLTDPRSWTNDPRFGFEHVDLDDDPNLRIQLTSGETTSEMCGQDLGLETSCRTTVTGESTVVVNEARWIRGAAPFQGDLGAYRQYLINHEVGHALGFASHEPCPADGELAPVMMQQTISLNNAELYNLNPEEVYPDTPETCRPNSWPYPRPAVV